MAERIGGLPAGGNFKGAKIIIMNVEKYAPGKSYSYINNHRVN